MLILFVVLVICNLIGFSLVGMDKHRSRIHSDRIPEVYFFFVATFFASLGVLLGVFYFRHKTLKMFFPVGLSVMFLQQIALGVLAFNYFKSIVG